MATIDELMTATVVLGRPGLAGAAVPAGQIAGIESRLTDLETAQIASLDDLPDVDLAGIAAGDYLRWDGAKLVKATPGKITIVSAFNYIIDGGGAVIMTGPRIPVRIGSACKIIANAIAVGDQVGDISIDIWRDGYANLPPTGDDSICGGSPLRIVGSRKGVNTVSTWQASLAADDFLVFNVQSVTALTACTVSLRVQQEVSAG